MMQSPPCASRVFMRRHGLGASAAALLIAVSACAGGDSSGPPDTTVTVASVILTGSNKLNVGSTTQLTASATGSDGAAMQGRTFSWTTSSTDIATVTDAGVVTGIAAGSVTITAATGGKSASLIITVSIPAPVTSTVEITGTQSVTVGGTTHLTASALTSTGTPITDKTFTWSSSNNGVATVASDGTVTGVSSGTATISATVDGVVGTRTVTVIVTPTVVITIAGSFTGQVGTTSQLTAVVKDANGIVMPNAPVTWTSSDPNNVSVSGTGLVTAVHIANVTITATSGNATANAPFSSALSPYTFSFPPGVSAAEQQMIKDNVQAAHALHKTLFNRQIQNPTVISALGVAGTCANGGAAAATTSGSLVICYQNPGWLQPSPILRQKIVQHELFHVWQWENHWLNNNPALIGAYWIAEGSAELMGFKGVDATGALTFATAAGCNVKESSDFATSHPPGLPALSAVETAQTFNGVQGPIYTTSMLGMNELTTQNGVGSLKTYADAIAAGTDWHTAFQTAFGVSAAAFYAGFPGYYASLPVPATYQCNF